MNQCGGRKGMRQTVRFRKLSSDRDCFLNQSQAAIRLTDEPRTPGGKGSHRDPRVERIDIRVLTLPIVIERERSHVVFQSRTKIALMRARDLHRPVASHREIRMADALSEPQELMGDAQ